MTHGFDIPGADAMFMEGFGQSWVDEFQGRVTESDVDRDVAGLALQNLISGL
jgi:hypothetical protein